MHGSTFRHEIIIDNADGNNLIGDICTVIGDRNGIKLAKAGVEDRHDTFANYWDSSFDIAYDSDTAINGYVFDMQSGFVGEGTEQSKVMSFKLDNLEVGKAYTLTFRGKFVHAQFVSGQESLVRICSTTAETPYLAQVTLEKDTDAHIYRIDFTNNTQDTTLYLNFWFYGVADDTETYHSEFIADDLIIAGMNIGIISRYIDYNGKWYPIEAGGGTSDLDAIELTYAEYQALTPAEKTDPDKIYFITDYPSGSGVVINPTGTATDTAETIEVDGTIYDFMDADAVHTADIGVAGGVAELDANGKVPSSQLPSYVDDVVEYASISAFPATGESGKIYIALDTNKTYRWTGSVYVEISPSLALGETSSTAYRGDRGKIAYDHSQSDHSGIAPAFTEASTRANIASGETFATLLGKIKKFFSDLKAVAFSGSYNDLSDQPTIPAAQVNSDWNATSGKAQILNKPSLATVATSGSYNDLSNKPTIPTVNNATLTIQKNGTNVETFTANASSNKTANITVPTKVSELTNDSGYTTNTGTVTQVKVGSTAYNPSSGIVSLPAYLISGYAYPSGNSNKPYFKVAEFEQSVSGQQINTQLNLFVSSYYSPLGDGILWVSCRWEANGIIPTWVKCVWLVANTSITLNNFVATWKYNSTTKIGTIKLYIKSTGWADYNVVKLSEHGWAGLEDNWTIYNASYSSALASIPSDETQIVSTLNTIGNSVSTATSATSATKATQDGDGNTISSTYLKKSGGTMTGTLTTKALEPSGTVNIGTASAPYNIVHANDVHAYAGGLESGKVGSSSVNSVAGHLYLYPDANKNTNYIDIRPASGTLSALRTIYVPLKAGTIALTSDIHTVREYTGTITGDVVRVTHNLGLGTSYKPIVSWNCGTAIVLYGMRNITTNYFELMFASINGYVLGTATGVSVTIRWTY